MNYFKLLHKGVYIVVVKEWNKRFYLHILFQYLCVVENIMFCLKIQFSLGVPVSCQLFFLERFGDHPSSDIHSWLCADLGWS